MKKIRNRRRIGIFVSWVAVILWMLLLFGLSAQPADQSDSFSRKVTEVIINAVGRIIPLDIESGTGVDLVSKYNNEVRKMGHGCGYFVLGVLMLNAMRQSGVRGLRGLILTLLICILYAISDEVHQLFVPGRGAQVQDVLIDSIGIVLGVGFWGGARA